MFFLNLHYTRYAYFRCYWKSVRFNIDQLYIENGSMAKIAKTDCSCCRIYTATCFALLAHILLFVSWEYFALFAPTNMRFNNNDLILLCANFQAATTCRA